MLAAWDPSKLDSYVIHDLSNRIEFFNRLPFPINFDTNCMKFKVHRPLYCLIDISTNIPPYFNLRISTSAWSIKTMFLSLNWLLCNLLSLLSELGVLSPEFSDLSKFGVSSIGFHSASLNFSNSLWILAKTNLYYYSLSIKIKG